MFVGIAVGFVLGLVAAWKFIPEPAWIKNLFGPAE
jgi:hypothetical protein